MAYAIIDNNNDVLGHVHNPDEAQHYIDENTYPYTAVPLGYVHVPNDVLALRSPVFCIDCGERITK
jgi:hypothetical protein